MLEKQHEPIAFELAQSVKTHNHKILYLCNSDKEARLIKNELKLFLDDSEIGYYPEREILPYDRFSTADSIIQKRIKLLNSDKSNKTESKLIYYGEGYITYINSLDEVKNIKEIFNILEKEKTKLNLQIIYNPNIQFEINLPFNELINTELYSLTQLNNSCENFNKDSAINFSTFKYIKSLTFD